jgi:phosphoenolpyruvate-protein phosphotransferase/dihydroxyacetone kinase phosphotransfer subunit
MVGIVVVSHSRALARASIALAAEMLHGRTVRTAVAAGLDETTFGTDAVRVKEAIEEVDGPDGVLVLMDLGSALLSAEMALDLLEPAVAGRVRLCSAPLVEGLVTATVAAAAGASIEEVEAEASAALAGKQSHLHFPGTASPVPPEAEEPSARAVFVVTNEHGLHARPAAKLVAEVRALDARVRLRNLTTGSGQVPGSSLSRVAVLGALAGHQLEVTATGNQARTAVDHIVALAARHFDEPSSAVPAVPLPADPRRGPLPASPGIAVGPSWTPARTDEPINRSDRSGRAVDPVAEWRRIRGAVAAVRRDTVRTRARTAHELGESEAGVFDAHLMLLDDTELLDIVRQRIDEGFTAPRAWSEVLDATWSELDELPDEYMRARAADVRGLRDQVLLAMSGRSTGLELRDGVLVIADLTPAEAAALDRDRVMGLVLAFGSPTGHAAILARARGIPAVVGAGAGVLEIPDGTTIALDGETGELLVDPDPETLVAIKARAVDRDRRVDVALRASTQPAITRDGTTVPVGANVGDAADASTAARYGADLAGLVRTEFLFLGRESAPTVDEQESAYRAVAEGLGGRRVVIRTFDIGGDKQVPYLDLAPEANPYLGLRGIRLALARPEILRDQLSAICRVAHDLPVSVMFPMVTHVDEVHAARALLAEAAALAGGSLPAGLEVGIMIEVPAAALKAAAFVPHVDFVSIGTNDLTQYTVAAERGNDSVATVADPLDPAVLRLVQQVCRAASGRIPVAVCGEVASEPDALPVLLGLGVNELSVTPYAVPLIKQAVRALALPACQALAGTSLGLRSAAEVRALVAASEVGRGPE